jgi:hypothetical protein
VGISQSGFTDDVGAAYESARFMLERHATTNGWTTAELEDALDDAKAIYDSIGGVTGWVSSFIDADVGESVGQDQVQDFWDQLADVSTTWTGGRVDELAASFGSAVSTTATVAENTVSTPTDYAETYVIDPLAMTAEDLGEVATDRKTWIIAGVAAALVLVLAIRR